MFGIQSFAGTIGTFANMMKLQNRWETKQEKGKYTEKSSLEEKDPLIRQLDEMRKQRQENSPKETIRTKMSIGKKLTREEMEYLKREDPATYQKAKEIQDTQKGYENALKSCKTKEDVQRLKATRMGATLTKVNAISNNPNIPEGQKMALLLHENAKVKAMLKAEQAFIESGRYGQLPTDAEQKEAMKQAAEALREEKTQEPETDQTVEETDDSSAPRPDGETTGQTEGTGTVPEEEKAEKKPLKDSSRHISGSDHPAAGISNPASQKKAPDHHKARAAYTKTAVETSQETTPAKTPQRRKISRKV